MTKATTARQRAIKGGASRYIGKICSKHPEAKSERLVSNRACIKCHNTKRHILTKRKYHEDPDWKRGYLDRKSRLKAEQNRYALYAASYRARKKERTPKWADMHEIREIYKKAANLGMHVDHYYPLCGETVSGLHVETNLRIISAEENDAKSNKHPVEFYGKEIY